MQANLSVKQKQKKIMKSKMCYFSNYIQVVAGKKIPPTKVELK